MPEGAVQTIRDALDASFDKAETSATPTPTESQPAAAPAAAPAQPSPSSPAPAAAPSDPGKEPRAPSPYLEKPGGAAPAVPGKPGEQPKPEEQPKPVGFKPPESWKQQVRDTHWKQIPVQAQAEILRRERQVEATLRGVAEVRKQAETVNGIIQQYKDVFAEENTHPFQTISNLLNISRVLRHSPPPQRAQMMAQVIQTYGVDLGLLDQALAFHVKNTNPQAQAQNGQFQQFQQLLDQRLAPIHQAFAGMHQQRQQQEQVYNQGIANEVETFANDPANEYFDLVRDEVADILEMGAKRGQKITLQEAYTRAMLANNDLAPLVSRQKVEEVARQMNSPAAQAAALAGMSVTGAPSGATPAAAAPTTIRGAIETSIDRLSGRA
jgi:hypothetical protein